MKVNTQARGFGGCEDGERRERIGMVVEGVEDCAEEKEEEEEEEDGEAVSLMGRRGGGRVAAEIRRRRGEREN